MDLRITKRIRFSKLSGGRTIECEIHEFEDGSVAIFGDETDTWMFEFTKDALERAVDQVMKEGYVRCVPEYE